MDEDTAKPTLAPQGGGDRAHVLYDGRCQECKAQVGRLKRWDKRGRLRFLSLHDPEVERLFPQLSHEAMMRQLHVVDQHGRLHLGAGAVRFLSGQLPRLWWAAPMLHVPFSMRLWQWLYHQVAISRYCDCAATARRSDKPQ